MSEKRTRVKDQKWTRTFIAHEQSLIKRELQVIEKADGEAARLEYVLNRIRELEENFSALAQLRRYVYIVSALVHHERNGGLSPAQIGRLANLATIILKIRGIKPNESALAFLYGDLHTVLSQIYRKVGQPWVSAWEQQLSLFLSKRAPTGGLGFSALSTAIRTLRLGEAGVALKQLNLAAQTEISPRFQNRVRLEQIKALRLGGDVHGALALAKTLLENPELRPEERQEVLWEKMCAELTVEGDMQPMINAVRKGGSHHQDTYLIDAFLWSRAIEGREWLGRFPTIKSLAWNPELKLKHLGMICKYATVLERCYFTHIPLNIRLQPIGRLLPQIQSLITIEKELLVWASLARWLSRNKSYSLAVLPLSEYQALSLRLSNGANKDGLGILGDLLERQWYKDMHAEIKQERPSKVIRFSFVKKA